MPLERFGSLNLYPLEDRQTGNLRTVRTTEDMVELLKSNFRFAKDEGGMLYVWRDGSYRAADDIIQRAVVEICEFTPMPWSSQRGREVELYILYSSPKLWDRPPLERINLLNGIYNWEQGILEPSSPEYLSTVQIPISYDPFATCPMWDRFMEDVLPGGSLLLTEIIGLCMIPFTGLQKCVVLVGAGSNGKSSYLNGLQAAVGYHNICNVSLHTLTSTTERFAKCQIVGKLVNVFGDMPARKIEDAAAFKPLTGEDRITIEYKHKDPFSYVPFCKLIFSCNEVPGSDDQTAGYKRRFLYIPFTKQFQVDPHKGKEIADALSSPAELSGLLNKILPRIPSIVEDGFSITPEIASIIDQWVVIPEKTRLWLESHIIYDPGVTTPMDTLYSTYSTDCPHTGEIRSRAKLVQFVKNVYPSVIIGERDYVGIRLSS